MKKLLLIAVLSMLSTGVLAGKTMTIVAGFPAGTGHDLVARQLAKDLSQNSDIDFVVENRVGAGGQIAVNEVSGLDDPARPKLLVFTNTLYVNTYLTKRYDRITPYLLKPVGFIGNVPLLLNVNSEKPIYNLKDLKKISGGVKAGTGGPGSIPEISSLYLADKLGLTVDSIPYPGQNKAFIDLSSGQLDMVFDYYKSSVPYIDSGKVRPIAVTGNKRLEAFPTVPTFREQGVEWPLEAFFMLYASKNIDPRTLADLRKKIAAIIKTNPEAYHNLGLITNNGYNSDIEKYHLDTMTKYQNFKLPYRKD